MAPAGGRIGQTRSAMQVFFPTETALHDPPFEVIEGGLRVPYSDASERVHRVVLALRQHGLGDPQPAPACDLSMLSSLHAPDYLDFLARAYADWQVEAPRHALPPGTPLLPALSSPRRPRQPGSASLQSVFARAGYYVLDLAAPITVGTWSAALDSAGCAIAAAQAVLSGQRAAFAVCRPPGHHAGRDFAAGFCYLNNAALAAQRLQTSLGARIALVDIDYHAGHGTQDLFYLRDDVVTLSLHADPAWEYPFYSGHADEAGAGPGHGYHRNLPLPRGIDDARYLDALDSGLAWLMRQRPQALVVSAGLDLAIDDPVGTFAITRAGLLQIGARLAALRLPTVLVLEGGYALDSLGENLVALLAAFA